METFTLSINVHTHKKKSKQISLFTCTDSEKGLWRGWLVLLWCDHNMGQRRQQEVSTPLHKRRRSWGSQDQWKDSWWSDKKNRWRINKWKGWCLERFLGSSPCCLASCYAVNMESLQHTLWHSTSRRQPLSSQPRAAKDQLCDFGELTNITSPAGVPFWREGKQQGLQAAARPASESTCRQLLACDLSVSGLGYQQCGFLYLTASETSGFWSRPEPSCMRHTGHLWFDWIFWGILLTSKIWVLNPVWPLATRSSYRFQDCIS